MARRRRPWPNGGGRRSLSIPDLCYGTVDAGCPFDCGLCDAHEQLPCSVLLEVTRPVQPALRRLFCRFRPWGGGGPDRLRTSRGCWNGPWLRQVRAISSCRGVSPPCGTTFRRSSKSRGRIGYSFIQVNTNGLRLAADIDYGRRLRAAGLSSVFLQFDGVDDEVHHRS